MAATKLRQLLDCFGNSQGLASLSDIANQLDISVSQAENMLDFWVRKGRIRITNSLSDCGSCGEKGNCPLALELPKVYELVGPGDLVEQNQSVPCSL